MKRSWPILMAAAVGFVGAYLWASQRMASQYLAETAAREAAWAAERDALEEAARKPAGTITLTNTVQAMQEVEARRRPAEILSDLKQLKLNRPQRTPIARHAVYLFESLARLGPEAVPVIRDFLATEEDFYIELGVARSRGSREIDALLHAAAPVSLRLGLFDVLREIGGGEAEKTLAQSLATSRRGVEVAYLARLLEEMAPAQHREAALAAARVLLLNPKAGGSSDPLDQNDADYLYGTLRFFSDPTFVAEAQAQVVKPDGKVDRNAVSYIEQALKEQALPLARQLYFDPRISDPASKEPLARVALNYVGLNAEAEQFYQQTINDNALPKGVRKNLIEDLNENGFADPKNLTPGDIPLIEKRLALIEQLAPNAMDPVNAAAFKEAYKDLVKMRQDAAAPRAK